MSNLCLEYDAMSFLSGFQGVLRVNAGPVQAEEEIPPLGGPVVLTVEKPKRTKSAKKEEGDPYMLRLVKLVPAEIVSLYLSYKDQAAEWIGGWAVVCLVLLLISRTIGTKGDGKPIQIGSILIAVVSYVLWIYATGGHFPRMEVSADWPKGIVSVAVGVWTWAIPRFYHGD
jgi:hypothetical protein